MKLDGDKLLADLEGKSKYIKDMISSPSGRCFDIDYIFSMKDKIAELDNIASKIRNGNYTIKD
jgi:hypothetical protein